MGIIRFLYWALIIVLAITFLYIIAICAGIPVLFLLISIAAPAMTMVFCSHHNLHRRLSLYSSGYVRPPFMLVIRRRPASMLRFLSNTFFSHDHHFGQRNLDYASQAPLHPGYAGYCPNDDHGSFFKSANPGPPPFRDYHHACYLWPDRLRWHFFMIALLYVIILRIDGAWVPAVIVAIFLVFIIPWFTYSFQRSPVLEGIWRTWPSFMNRWFKGLADLDTHWSLQEK